MTMRFRNRTSVRSGLGRIRAVPGVRPGYSLASRDSRRLDPNLKEND